MATALWERQWLDRSAEGCSGMGAKAADGDGAVGASVAGPIGQADGRSGMGARAADDHGQRDGCSGIGARAADGDGAMKTPVATSIGRIE